MITLVLWGLLGLGYTIKGYVGNDDALLRTGLIMVCIVVCASVIIQKLGEKK